MFHDGVWTNSALLPSQGISRAYNPEMRVTHQRVTYLDENDAMVAKTSSIVSVVWWEEAALLQARFAALFLDETAFDPANLSVYDLPALTGGVGASVYDDVPSGAYLYPTLQADGLSGAVLASYADLHDLRHRVLQIRFPDFQGKPSDDTSMDWKRRHTPIVGIASDGPLADMTPRLPPHAKPKDAVGTSIGAGYRPTMYWLEEGSLKYTRLGATEWEPVRERPGQRVHDLREGPRPRRRHGLAQLTAQRSQRPRAVIPRPQRRADSTEAGPRRLRLPRRRPAPDSISLPLAPHLR